MLSDFFNDVSTGHDAVAEDDSTTILSSGRCLNFSWDHGKHHRCFTNPDSKLPELCLYQGTGYFSAFCSRIEIVYKNNMNFDFSLYFSLKPNPQVVSDDESDSESDTDEDKEWFLQPQYPLQIPIQKRATIPLSILNLE